MAEQPGNKVTLAWMGDLLHRKLWRSLPYGLRRSALFQATALAAPRRSSSAVATMPLTIVGTFRAASGLGQSARLSYQALRAAGIAAGAIDLTAALRQPADLPALAAADGRSSGPGTLLVHVNGPLMPLACLALGRDVIRAKYVIGYWAWELPHMPAEWRLGLPFVHEIWVPSRFTASAIATIATKQPIRVVPHPVAVRRPPPTSTKEDRPFTVLTFCDACSSTVRKNVEGAIKAFREAFGSDPGTRLIVKAMHLDAAPQAAARIRELCAAQNIVLDESVVDATELDDLYAQAHVVLSLHRSEGFGLTLAEGMLRGVPVVATGWSGNADFTTKACGVPVPCRLVPAEDPQRTYHFPDMRWAEPDVSAAARALVALRADPDRRQRLGAAAAAFAMANWSIENYACCVREALADTIGVAKPSVVKQ